MEGGGVTMFRGGPSVGRSSGKHHGQLRQQKRPSRPAEAAYFRVTPTSSSRASSLAMTWGSPPGDHVGISQRASKAGLALRSAQQRQSDQIRSISRSQSRGSSSSGTRPATSVLITGRGSYRGRSRTRRYRCEHNDLGHPLAGGRVAAGFPSPADDVEVGIDLNEQLIRHPGSTFFCGSAVTP